MRIEYFRCKIFFFLQNKNKIMLQEANKRKFPSPHFILANSFTLYLNVKPNKNVSHTLFCGQGCKDTEIEAAVMRLSGR